jgi:hypothetical protein
MQRPLHDEQRPCCDSEEEEVVHHYHAVVAARASCEAAKDAVDDTEAVAHESHPHRHCHEEEENADVGVAQAGSCEVVVTGVVVAVVEVAHADAFHDNHS